MIPCDDENINKSYKILRSELEKYNPELLDKDHILAITKVDLLDDEMRQLIEDDIKVDIPYLFISSHTTEGLTTLKDTIWKSLNQDEKR